MKIPLTYSQFINSYNKEPENDENFKMYMAKIENLLKLWRARSPSLEWEITVFRSLALS